MGRYVYGPVLSRRLGWSLGIDVMPKLKTCTFNCVYCELGKTSTQGYVSKDFRYEFPPNFVEDFTNELRTKLIEHSAYIKSLTFGYNGEPTLQKYLDLAFDISHKLRFDAGIDNRVPITILTNASTLEFPEIREKLSNFDIVIAKLDAGAQKIFKYVNLPHHSIPPLNKIIENLKQLKSEMKTGRKLYIQTLLYKVRLPTTIQSNATGDNIVAIANAINEIQPDQVQVYTVSRQPADPSVIPLTKFELIELSDLMASNVKELRDIYYFP
ncbi:MAG TPA: radical SAM protein [Candidatus Deferrimicrobium sp.]|nr:radical SAM protein [Candidatus Deferrimicrobium sp.]